MSDSGTSSCSADGHVVATAATNTKPVATPFEQLCSDGSQWTRSNWMVKLARWPMTLLRQTYLVWLCFSVPSNFLMLTCRTYLRDFGAPESNSDDLAPLFRDELMPLKGSLHRRRSPLIRFSRAVMEIPFLGVPGTVHFINARTRWFDDGVQAALDAGIKQVVVVAAGYDTRAYRFSRPGVRFFEVDLPHASKRKQELVHKLLPADKAGCVEYVAADLSKVKLADALASTGFNPEEPTLFTIEGLLCYLTPDALWQLFASIAHSSAAGSRLMYDFMHLSTCSGAVWHPGWEAAALALGNRGERLKSCINERPEAVQELMGLFGFTATAVLTAGDMIGRYLPHVQNKRRVVPVIPPYFGYVSARKL